MTDRTSLYRLYDADEALLYVGIAGRPEFRWTQHSREKKWWREVCHYKVEWHATRQDAFQAETKAIRSERPRYNIANTMPGCASRSVRIKDPEWEAAAVVTDYMGLDRTKLMKEYLDWYFHKPGAELRRLPMPILSVILEEAAEGFAEDEPGSRRHIAVRQMADEVAARAQRANEAVSS